MNRLFVSVSVGLSLAVAAAAEASVLDFEISQDGSAQHRLLLTFPTGPTMPYPLQPVNDGPLAGHFADIEPGWDGMLATPPDGVHFPLLAGDGVGIRMLSATPGFVMFDGLLNPILSDPTEAHEFAGDNEGNPALWWHEHLRFAVEPGNPLGIYSATFQLTDVNGLHADSAPVTITYEAVPEPGSISLLLGGLIVAARRRF